MNYIALLKIPHEAGIAGDGNDSFINTRERALPIVVRSRLSTRQLSTTSEVYRGADLKSLKNRSPICPKPEAGIEGQM